MIVFSGALIALAAVLLVVGALGNGLALVYTSIVLSLVAGLVLVLRAAVVRLRRGRSARLAAGSAPLARGADVLPGGAGTPAVTADVAADALPAQPQPAHRPDPPPSDLEPAEEDGEALEALLRQLDDDPDLLDEDDGLAIVVVVSGRPRYHLDGCPELGDEVGVDLDVLEAREEGFTPCGVCRPDAEIVAQVARERAAEARASARPRRGRDGVVVVPSTGLFHRSSCPLVREAGDAQPTDRPHAVQLGYRPCPSCRA